MKCKRDDQPIRASEAKHDKKLWRELTLCSFARKNKKEKQNMSDDGDRTSDSAGIE
jgi:hypothetical protein